MGTQSLTLITEDGVEYKWGTLADGELLVVDGDTINSEVLTIPSSGLNQAQVLTLVSYRG